jgi:Calx-beta domain/Fibronectin type III domain
MKKVSLILLLCFSAFLIEPTTAYLKGKRPESDVRKRLNKSAAPDPPKPRTPSGSSAQTSAFGSDANSATPAREMKVKDLPKTSLTSLEPAEEEEDDEPLSDIDPETLSQLKRKGAASRSTVESLLNGSTANEDASASTGAVKAGISPLAPTLVSNFAGVSDSDQTDGFIHKPPDTNMAVGPSNIVIVVNNLIAVYSKTGTLQSKTSLATWFTNLNLSTCNGCIIFDPRVAYDSAENKWIIVALYKDLTSQSKVLVSVSQTSSPTGSWWIYGLTGTLNFSGDDTWADYPDVGFDGISSANAGAVYITVNQFTFGTRLFRTGLIFIIRKSELYAGASVNYWRTWDRRNGDNTQAFTFRAAKTYGNPGGEFLVNTKNGGSTLSLWRINPTYPPTAIDMTLQSTINIGAYSVPPNATQPGTADLIDTMDNRAFGAVWQNNRLYTAFNEAHDWGGGGGTVTAFRYLKINTSANIAEINDFFGADGLHYYCPAIAADNADNIVVVFSRSNGSEFAGVRYTGRLTSESALQGSASLKAGTAAITTESGETKSRWGDYQGAAIDPSDGTKVWIYGEYAVDLAGITNDFDWGTWIGQVQFSGSTPPPSAPTATAATNIATNSFSANWNASANATGYRLDVSPNNTFSSFVAGFQDLDVGNVLTRSVTGLNPNTNYFYRVRAYNSGGTSATSSNTISTTTLQTPQVQFTSSAFGVSENANPGFINITVSRSGSTAGASSVNYTTTNGTAKEGKDYVHAIGVLTLNAGETSKTFPVLIINNAFVDGSRTVNIALSNVTGATLGAQTTTVLTISNDDASLGANPLDTPHSFVQFDYYDFLGRYPDTAGWDFWTQQITNCGSNAQCIEVARINVSASFFLSIEFQQTGYLVERLYKAAYGNATGNSGLNGAHTLPVPIVRFDEFLRDTQRIRQGVVVLQPGWEALLESNKQAYALEFVQTSRFITAFPTSLTPAQFVDQLNTRAGNVLSTSERTNAINLFGGAGNTTNTTARSQACRQVAEDNDLYNAEYNRAFVLAEYFGYLRRNPNDPPENTLDYTGFEFWLNKLNSANGNYINAEMVKAFLSSIEYRQRFGPQ